MKRNLSICNWILVSLTVLIVDSLQNFPQTPAFGFLFLPVLLSLKEGSFVSLFPMVRDNSRPHAMPHPNPFSVLPSRSPLFLARILF